MKNKTWNLRSIYGLKVLFFEIAVRMGTENRITSDGKQKMGGDSTYFDQIWGKGKVMIW
ncbi:hypothetical protein NST21_22790 [Peribacillus sp. FSL K6-1552]|uniref:hypothetical protein n=1 Tax=Peribacillus sp. FSL K6-1552 TaxID=2954514 RepID=UPI0030F89656